MCNAYTLVRNHNFFNVKHFVFLFSKANFICINWRLFEYLIWKQTLFIVSSLLYLYLVIDHGNHEKKETMLIENMQQLFQQANKEIEQLQIDDTRNQKLLSELEEQKNMMTL